MVISDVTQQSALSLLASGIKVGAVAVELKIDLPALQRLRRTPAFSEAYRHRCLELKADNLRDLPALIAKAHGRLYELLDSADENIRFKSAQTVVAAYKLWVTEDHREDLSKWSEGRIRAERNRVIQDLAKMDTVEPKKIAEAEFQMDVDSVGSASAIVDTNGT